MTFEADDLPGGYPPVWDLTTRFMSARLEVRRVQNRTHYADFYAKAKRDAEWVAKRRAYYRARYAAAKKGGDERPTASRRANPQEASP